MNKSNCTVYSWTIIIVMYTNQPSTNLSFTFFNNNFNAEMMYSFVMFYSCYVLWCTVLSCYIAVMFYDVRFCHVLWCTVLSCSMMYSSVTITLWYTVMSFIVPLCIFLSWFVPCCTIVSCTVLLCTVKSC